MLRPCGLRRAVNRSAGRRWSPIASPPPPGADRLCGLHSVLNALRAFARGHPHRRRPHCLYVRDFRSEGDDDHNINNNTTTTTTTTTSDHDHNSVEIPAAYANLRRVVRMARALSVDVRAVERRELVRLCGERRHQNAVLEASSFEPRDIVSCPTRPAHVLYLDHVMDPANVGAIARSAFFFGVRDIVLSGDSAKCTPAVARASAGLVEHMRVYRSAVPTVEFIANTQAQAKAQAQAQRGTRGMRDELLPLQIIAATAHMPRNALREECAILKESASGDGSGRARRLLLLGNESAGLPRDVLALCTHTVHIPMKWAPPLPKIGENEVDDNDDGHVGPQEAETNGKMTTGVNGKWVDVLRAQEVSLNVSAASAVLLAALISGNGAAQVRPIALKQ